MRGLPGQMARTRGGGGRPGTQHTVQESMYGEATLHLDDVTALSERWPHPQPSQVLAPPSSEAALFFLPFQICGCQVEQEDENTGLTMQFPDVWAIWDRSSGKPAHLRANLTDRGWM